MAETGNAALAKRWFEEVWNGRREKTVYELMAPECEGHMEGPGAVDPMNSRPLEGRSSRRSRISTSRSRA